MFHAIVLFPQLQKMERERRSPRLRISSLRRKPRTGSRVTYYVLKPREVIRNRSKRSRPTHPTNSRKDRWLPRRGDARNKKIDSAQPEKTSSDTPSDKGFVDIDSDDEDTYYVFASDAREGGASVALSAESQPSSELNSASQLSRASNERKTKRNKLSKQFPKITASSVSQRGYYIRPSSRVTSQPVTKPLVVDCSHSRNFNNELMGPPPSPFVGIRNASVRPGS